MSLNVRSWRPRWPQTWRSRVIVISVVLVAFGLIAASVLGLPYGDSNAPVTQQPAARSLVPAQDKYLLYGGSVPTLPTEDSQVIKVSGASDADLEARVNGVSTTIKLNNTWRHMPGGSLFVGGQGLDVIGRWNPLEYPVLPTFSAQVGPIGPVSATVTIGNDAYPNVLVGATGGASGKTYVNHSEFNLLDFHLNSESCQATAMVAASSGTLVSLTSGSAVLSEVMARDDGSAFSIIANLQRSDSALSVGIVGPDSHQAMSLVIPLDPQQMASCPTQRRAA